MEPNPGKMLTIEVDGCRYERHPIRTHVIAPGEEIGDVLRTYVSRRLRRGDMIFISERAVATAQGRAYPIESIHPSRLARLLARFVHKSPHGIGIGSPWTMELALREAGVPKILLGALCSALTKPFGLRGVFYRVAGRNVAAIDGPAAYVLPPYDSYAKLAPRNPDGVATSMAAIFGCEVVIIDANDLGVAVLGRSTPLISDDFARNVFRDNPLGQSREQTPIAIVRKAASFDPRPISAGTGAGRRRATRQRCPGA